MCINITIKEVVYGEMKAIVGGGGRGEDRRK